MLPFFLVIFTLIFVCVFLCALTTYYSCWCCSAPSVCLCPLCNTKVWRRLLLFDRSCPEVDGPESPVRCRSVCGESECPTAGTWTNCPLPILFPGNFGPGHCKNSCCLKHFKLNQYTHVISLNTWEKNVWVEVSQQFKDTKSNLPIVLDKLGFFFFLEKINRINLLSNFTREKKALSLFNFSTLTSCSEIMVFDYCCT